MFLPLKRCEKVQWPSGLRRSTQVRVSSEAWVRTPPEPHLFLCLSVCSTTRVPRWFTYKLKLREQSFVEEKFQLDLMFERVSNWPVAVTFCSNHLRETRETFSLHLKLNCRLGFLKKLVWKTSNSSKIHENLKNLRQTLKITDFFSNFWFSLFVFF